MSHIDSKGDVHLRPYQLEALREIHERVAAGRRRVLVVAATGAGKTVIFARLVADAVRGGKTALVIAHRRELIHQTYRKLVDAGLRERQVGVLMATDRRRRPGAPVQVASIDTLRHRAKPRADMVILDEAHRELTRSMAAVRAAYPNALHLGFTATPFRADNRGLGEFYDELIVAASIGSLIEQGFLVEPRVFTVPTDRLPDLGGVRLRGGDYDPGQLDQAVNQARLVGEIVSHWQEHAAGARTVAFAASVKHSQHIAERFRSAGVAAEHLDATTPVAERDAILARLEGGETLVVSNCGVLCLDEKTEILTLAGWRGIDEMTEDHLVANWDNGVVTFEPPLDIVRRSRLPGERMARLKGLSLDIRVTEGHGIVYRTSKDGGWGKRAARELVGRALYLAAAGHAGRRLLVAKPLPPSCAPRRVRRALAQLKRQLSRLEGLTGDKAHLEACARVARCTYLHAKDPEELSLEECSFIGFWLGHGLFKRLARGGVEYWLVNNSRNAQSVAWLDRVIHALDVDFIKRTIDPPREE
jgi:hypothetical protein